MRIGDTGLTGVTGDVAVLQRVSSDVSTRTLRRDRFVGWAHPFYDSAKRIAGGFLDGGVFAAIGFKVRAVSQSVRDGPFGTPIAADNCSRRVNRVVRSTSGPPFGSIF